MFARNDSFLGLGYSALYGRVVLCEAVQNGGKSVPDDST